jgi:8-oxo-dGTP pyrophosphatase MutT (NUDIX family)
VTEAHPVTRDFTATTFVVWGGGVLLHKHKKLGHWFPCGGHIEQDELPDEAAVREVLEESGVRVALIGERALPIREPRQLVRPRGVQLETISAGHEHIDLIYFAKPVPDYHGELLEADETLGWYSLDALKGLELTEEIRHWATLALLELS